MPEQISFCVAEVGEVSRSTHAPTTITSQSTSSLPNNIRVSAMLALEYG
jgi:hypothetical protein